MKKLKLFALMLYAIMSAQGYAQQATPVSYFGAIPDLKVSGAEFVDPNGKPVTLHGVMDTPSAYFNANRWTDGIPWPYYGEAKAISAVKDYFTKVFQAIANPAKGTYCNLFRLHLDPCWMTYAKDTKASGFTTSADGKTVYDPHGNVVDGEASICYFDMDKFKARMTDLYIPLIQDALAHGLYVVVRPPGVFPHDIWVGDYYNDFLNEIWDIISKNEYIKAHSGQIMLELGNEPVRIWKTGETIPATENDRKSKYNGYSENSTVLADFFQPMVTIIRNNGFDGIILLPGTSFQANYVSYKKKAITDAKNNYGYAVHCYPGWYGGWTPTQTEAEFIATFESQVLTDKPIVITEVDWSPEWRQSEKSHWNEDHTQFTAGNYGTWGTGTTNGVTSGVDLVAEQNIGWGMKFRHLVDKHTNISWTLQGTTTFVDMDQYLQDGTVQPAFLVEMMKDRYPDARQACSQTCFDWFKEYACGNRVPYGTPNVTPEVPITPSYKTTAEVVGNAYFDKSNAHYCFYTPTNSAFIFKEFAGKELSACKTLTINLGEGSIIGYRLDVQLKDKVGNIIKDGNNDFIIGTELKGTRFTSSENKTFEFQTIFADYLTQYPGCKLGNIRLNTVVDGGNQDTDKAGKYWFTIDKMEMTYKKTFPAGVNQYHDETDGKYYFFEPYGSSFEFDQFASKKAMLCDELTVHCNQSSSTVGYRLDIYVTDPSGATITTHYKQAWGDEATAENVVIGESEKGTRFTEPVGDMTFDMQKILKEVLQEHPDAVIGNIRLNTVVSASDANREGLYYVTMTGMNMTEAPDDRVAVSKEKIVEEVKDLSEFKMYNYDNATPREITDTYIRYNKELSGGEEVFGVNGSVYYKDYSNLTGYTKMKIYGSGEGTLRIMFNRVENNGSLIEIKTKLSSGLGVVDLSSYDHVYLHSIKLAYEGNVTVNSIKLSKQVVGGESDFDADYYFYGDGSMKGEAKFALMDETATVIDLQGMSNTQKVNSITAANPNCLFIYNDDEKVNAYGGNFVKNNSWGYSAWRINLEDGYEFNAPVNIGTAAKDYDKTNPYGASYTRDLGTNNWATMALPFELDVTYAGSPEVYVLNNVGNETMTFNKVSEGTVSAGSVILYYNADGNETKLFGNNIAKTVDGFNVQPVGETGWYTAQSFKHQVIADVAQDPVLKDYDVYAISKGKFVLATKKLTLKPFRALYLKKKGTSAAKASFAISISETAAGIEETRLVGEDGESTRYDIMGRKLNAPANGINIIRMKNGTVRKVLNK